MVLPEPDFRAGLRVAAGTALSEVGVGSASLVRMARALAVGFKTRFVFDTPACPERPTAARIRRVPQPVNTPTTNGATTNHVFSIPSFQADLDRLIQLHPMTPYDTL